MTRQDDVINPVYVNFSWLGDYQSAAAEYGAGDEAASAEAQLEALESGLANYDLTRVDAVLKVQLILQVIQAFAYMFNVIVPIAGCCKKGMCCNKCTMIFHWINAHVFFIVVPVASIVHYYFNYKANLMVTNLLRPWLLVYPIAGVFFIAFYFMFGW